MLKPTDVIENETFRESGQQREQNEDLAACLARTLGATGAGNGWPTPTLQTSGATSHTSASVNIPGQTQAAEAQ